MRLPINTYLADASLPASGSGDPRVDKFRLRSCLATITKSNSRNLGLEDDASGSPFEA